MIDLLLTKVLNMRWDFFFILILASRVIFHFIPYRSLDYFHSILTMDHYYYYILKNIIGQGKKFRGTYTFKWYSVLRRNSSCLSGHLKQTTACAKDGHYSLEGEGRRWREMKPEWQIWTWYREICKPLSPMDIGKPRKVLKQEKSH